MWRRRPPHYAGDVPEGAEGSVAPHRLTVGVVGVGRAGSAVGAALRRAGHRVVAVSAVSELSRVRAEAMLPGVPVTEVPAVVRGRDLVVLAVPDDVLPKLVVGLAATGAFSAGQFVVHLSGRFGTDVLAPATAAGALPLALHPVMTFTGTSVDLARLDGCPFGVTAPEVLRPVAEALVVEMGGDPVWVAEEHRGLYHAALANSSNHLITLVAQTLDLLSHAGVDDPARLVWPLLHASLDNALDAGDRALTGPVSRGDAGTVAMHVAEIGAVSRAAQSAYIAMARLTADRALAAGRLSPEQAASLLGALAPVEGA